MEIAVEDIDEMNTLFLDAKRYVAFFDGTARDGRGRALTPLVTHLFSPFSSTEVLETATGMLGR